MSLPNSSVIPAGTFTNVSDNMRSHEGGLATILDAKETLRRTTLSCLLWEKGFYEDGIDIADRISQLIPSIDPQDVFDIAVEASDQMKLRHVPLYIAVEMLNHPEHKKLVRRLVNKVVKRPDELVEIISIYWRKELKPVRSDSGKFVSQRFAQGRKIPMQLLRGCRDAFTKFDQYQMLRWQEKGGAVTLADVIKIVHPDPTLAVRKSQSIDMSMSDVYAAIVNKTAKAPDTWESQLSAAGKEAKKDIFTNMISQNRLGAQALLMNLRGMIEAGVDLDTIKTALLNMNVERLLPYRFITAARYAPALKNELQDAMFRCVRDIPKLGGKTVLLVDISGSMSSAMSRRPNGRESDLRRIDGAAALCILAQAICERTAIYLFNTATYKVDDQAIDIVTKIDPLKRGYGVSTTTKTYPFKLVGLDLAEAISKSVAGGTDIAQAVNHVNINEQYDRLIIFSDEQSSTTPRMPNEGTLGYSINVATNDCGIGYGSFCHINGFSEAILNYIAAYEEQLKK